MENVMKRKSVDLPSVVLDRLSEMAVRSGKTLKEYMESVLTVKAEHGSPSPSGDAWFDDEENIRMVKDGIEDLESGKGNVYSSAELKTRLGL